MMDEHTSPVADEPTTAVAEQPADEVEQPHERKWQPLNSRQRRVLGVLVEKAKTTPEQYPMTLNGLTNGCNQKSNRSPQLNLSTEEVEEALEHLRRIGAAAEVQTAGRVPKYRHYAYEWLGVEKVESAVMTELLLRGEQTVGELRGRAARMEPIADLAALRPVLQSLMDKGLVISLSPEGRGQVVTHALYTEREMKELKTQFAGAGSAPSTSASAAPDREVAAASSETEDELDELKNEVAELRAEVADLLRRLEQIEGIVQ